MPDQLTVPEFMDITNEDYKAPTTSVFSTRMAHCRNTVAVLEEVKHLYKVNNTDVQHNTIYRRARSAQYTIMKSL